LPGLADGRVRGWGVDSLDASTSTGELLRNYVFS
jgi:hypothetical protein